MNRLYLFSLFLTFLSCSGEDDGFTSPPGYNLTKPEKFTMPDVLNEISGISFYKGDKDTIYAEQDEEGKLYYLHLGDTKASHVKFGKRGDFEDVAITNDWVIMLRSDGILFSFPFKDVRHEETTNVNEWDGLLPAGEFEGLYADAADNKLYVLCKHCSNDETREAISTYILQLKPDGSIVQDGSASISVKSIEKLSGEKKIKFHPSALAKNPKTQQWYILSSVNKMLVIADNAWNITAVYKLNPAVFRQPEGICFDSQNNLYISNEGDKISKANVLKFIFKKGN
jgi:hypothetical protein